jgi:hypothetical protein
MVERLEVLDTLGDIDSDFVKNVFDSLSVFQTKTKPSTTLLSLKTLFTNRPGEWISLSEARAGFERTTEPRRQASNGVRRLDKMLRDENKSLEIISVSVVSRDVTETYYHLRKIE